MTADDIKLSWSVISWVLRRGWRPFSRFSERRTTTNILSLPLLVFSLLGGLVNLELSAQTPEVLGARFEPDGSVFITHHSTPHSDYVLLFGPSLSTVSFPIATNVGRLGTDVFRGMVPDDLETGFYRIARVPKPTGLPFPPRLDEIPTAIHESFLILRGLAPINSTVAITGGRTPLTVLTDASGRFEGRIELLTNRVNRLVVTAFTPPSQQNSASVDVWQDSTPPGLFVDSPTTGFTTTAVALTVSGRVGDLLASHLPILVTVTNLSNGEGGPAVVVQSQGLSGTFQRGHLPLVSGYNQILVTASDSAGNSTFQEIGVFQRAATSDVRLTLRSGGDQYGPVASRLPQPIRLQVHSAIGLPFPNRLLTIRVTRSDGRLVAANPASVVFAGPKSTMLSGGVTTLQLLTDDDGMAEFHWTLGRDAGSANNQLTVELQGADDPLYLQASGQPLAPSEIRVGTGNHQRAGTGSQALQVLRSWVSDGLNGVSGVPVSYRVVQGGGYLRRKVVSSSSDTFTVTAEEWSNEVLSPTGPSGHAEVELLLGSRPGRVEIEASFRGNPGPPARFFAYGLSPTPGAVTRFYGVVLDNTYTPIGGATCLLRLHQSGQVLEGATDDQGRISFFPPNAGPMALYVYGQTATSLGTRAVPTNFFPSLHFESVLIPGASNSLSGPILLPCLNTNNARLYAGTNDLELTCEGIDGLRIRIHANSMRHFDGRPVSPEAPAWVSLNQVHADKIPMPLPDGRTAPFTWTLQPSGSRMDPPASIEWPNMSGMPAGAVVQFVSFDHDTERFEVVATGHVNDDASLVYSDPGMGLTIAGWGAGLNGFAPRVSADVRRPPDIPCDEPGGACDDADAFTTNDRCQEGGCAGDRMSCTEVPPGVEFDCVNGKAFPKTDEPESSPCDDGDPSTTNDRIQNGVCRGDPTGPVVIQADIVDVLAPGDTFVSGVNKASIQLILNGVAVQPEIVEIDGGYRINYKANNLELKGIGNNQVQVKASDNLGLTIKSGWFQWNF